MTTVSSIEWTEQTWNPSVPILRPLLERPRSEFLINLMYDFVNRTLSMAGWKEEMVELIGEQLALTGMDPTEREQRIVRTYRQNLKACAPCSNRAYPPRAAHVRVMDPEKDRTKYQLVYLTSHAKGPDLFYAGNCRVG